MEKENKQQANNNKIYVNKTLRLSCFVKVRTNI